MLPNLTHVSCEGVSSVADVFPTSLTVHPHHPFHELASAINLAQGSRLVTSGLGTSVSEAKIASVITTLLPCPHCLRARHDHPRDQSQGHTQVISRTRSR